MQRGKCAGTPGRTSSGGELPQRVQCWREGLLLLALYQAIKSTCDVETINCQLIEILSVGVFVFILAFKSKKNSLKQFAWWH